MTTSPEAALLVLGVRPAMLPASDSLVPAVARALAHARRRGLLVRYVVVGFRPGRPRWPRATRPG